MARSWSGSWWRPHNNVEEVGGELTLDDDTGLSLRLFGSLAVAPGEHLTRWPPEVDPREAVIHGVADGTRFTLLNATCSDVLPMPRSGSELWRVEAAIEGHLAPPNAGEEMLFDGIRVELEHLGVWARARDVEIRRLFDESKRLELTGQPHELGNCRLPDGTSISLDQALNTKHDRAPTFSIALPVAAIVRPAVAVTWPRLLNRYLQPIQVLLWLATGFPSRVEDIRVRVEDESGRASWVPLHVSLMQPTSGSSREVFPHDVLFFADELRPGFDEGLRRWFELWGEIRHVLGPVFARARASVYANDRFYTAAAAIEGYHRYCPDSQRDIATVEHRVRVRRLRTVLEQHAPDLTEWAVNSARDFNRIPSWRRLTQILDVLGPVGERLVGVHGEFFAHEVEAARHNHAHALSSLIADDEEDDDTRPFVHGPGLHRAAAGIVWMLRTAVLVDLGFDIDDAIERITRNRFFRWDADRLRELLEQAAEQQGSA